MKYTKATESQTPTSIPTLWVSRNVTNPRSYLAKDKKKTVEGQAGQEGAGGEAQQQGWLWLGWVFACVSFPHVFMTKSFVRLACSVKKPVEICQKPDHRRTHLSETFWRLQKTMKMTRDKTVGDRQTCTTGRVKPNVYN